MLLFQSSHHRHDPFSKTTASLALSAETTFTPKNTGADLSLSQIVGWLNAFNPNEGPQGRFSFENIPASGSGFVMATGCAQPQQLADIVLDWFHLFLKGEPRHGSIPHSIPPVKHQLNLSQERFTQKLREAASLNESLKVTAEVSPTELT